MVFTSLAFCTFIIVLFIAYYTIPLIKGGTQWIILLLFSLFFYTYNSPRYAIFLTVSVLTTWLAALYINKKGVPFLCIIANIGILCFIKYAPFFARLNNKTTEWLIIPLGISFYTFQSIGYCIDVKRGVIEPERNLLKYALFVSFFPQISQGPIGRYDELMPQLISDHSFDYDRFVRGLERMLLGFFKKILIANNLSRIVDEAYGNYNVYSGKIMILGTIMYAFQLYADFSGYMDIALGCGECLGITLSENFRTPYFSESISEYWRRWHITLGAWFKDYLYYPILRSDFISGINRNLRKSGHKKAARSLTTSIGLLITWLCIGMWHGASLNFIAHGLFHGFFLIMATLLSDFYVSCRNTLHLAEDSHIFRLFRILRTFTIVNIGYVMFRSDSMRMALGIYNRIIRHFNDDGLIVFLHSYDRAFWFITIAAMTICLIIDLVETQNKWPDLFHRLPTFIRWASLYVMAFLTLIYAFDQPASAQAFLYFDF